MVHKKSNAGKAQSILVEEEQLRCVGEINYRAAEVYH